MGIDKPPTTWPDVAMAIVEGLGILLFIALISFVLWVFNGMPGVSK